MVLGRERVLCMNLCSSISVIACMSDVSTCSKHFYAYDLGEFALLHVRCCEMPFTYLIDALCQ